jgi:DNA-binding transcriptional MerR regulator
MTTQDGTVVDVDIEYRIDDLARLAGTTVRNVRSYQDRGLLPAPRRQGRVALYSEAHLARLRLISQMLERGYSLANIRELVDAWESGQNVGDLLGLEAALGGPWSDESPLVLGSAELGALFGATGSGGGEEAAVSEAIAGAVAAGVLELQESGAYLVKSPRLLTIAAELVSAGIPLAAVLELGRALFADVDRIARRFVDLVTEHVFDPVGEPLPAEEVPRLAEVVRRLRPLAQESVDAVLAEAMERHVAEELRVRLTRLFGGRRSEAS